MGFSEKLKVFALYAGYWLLFAAVFAAMFAFLTVCVIGIPSGLMLAVLGIGVLLFRADFILTQLSPQLMLFGGLAGAFFTAFLGLSAVKLGYMISRLFLRIKRRCDAIRDW